MSRTLLYTVQRVLEKLDLDVVNSINDSQDAILVAREAEDTFYDLVNRAEWPQNQTLIQMQSVSDVNNPTALRLSEDTLDVTSLRYDISKSTDTNTNFRELQQLTNEEFIALTVNRNSSDADVVEATYNGVGMYIYNDKAPTYFTVFDNSYVILDSWYQTEESTVAGNKTICTGVTAPTFTMEDDFILPLDMKTFPLFLAELTSAASIALTGVVAMEEDRRRFRAISRLRRNPQTVGQRSFKNTFGRKGTGKS